LPAYIDEYQKTSKGNKTTYYRVRIGAFESQQSAKRFGEKFLTHNGYRYDIQHHNNAKLATANTSPQFTKNGRYFIQIGSFKQKLTAVNTATRLKQSGYPAYIDDAASGENDILYRVRIGDFSTQSSAKEFGEKSLAKKGYNYLIYKR
jgi:cell division septation protein DedD